MSIAKIVGMTVGIPSIVLSIIACFYAMQFSKSTGGLIGKSFKKISIGCICLIFSAAFQGIVMGALDIHKDSVIVALVSAGSALFGSVFLILGFKDIMHSTKINNLKDNNKDKTQHFSSKIDKILEYLISLVVRKDLIEELIKRMDEAKLFPKYQKINEFFKIFYELEEFILKHEPFIIKKKYTKDSLRKEISQNVGILQKPYNIIYKDDIDQIFSIIEFMSNLIIDQINTLVGVSGSRNIFNEVKINEFLSTQFDSSEQILLNYKEILSNLFNTLSMNVGQSNAKDIISKNYKAAEQMYGFLPCLEELLKILPSGILDEEKIKVLSKDELRSSNKNLREIEQKLKLKEIELLKSNREFEIKVEELERYNKLMVGRELKMKELKNEINELLEKLGEPKKYKEE